jgi:DHA2 family multidrug resistance protein
MAPGSVRHHGILTVSVMMATILQALDATIANVALPRMQGTLLATQDQMSWVLTSYIVSSAIMMPLTGWLANRFDGKLVFLISVGGFTISSVLCGMAQTLPEIVLFRALQGMSGAALIPLSQALLFDINPPERHGTAMATWGVGATLGPILGPALGGWLTEEYNWRYVFYINLPIGILTFLGLLFFMPRQKGRRAADFDFFGFAFLALAIGAFQVMLDRGEIKDWFSSSEIITEAIIAALALYLLVIHSLTHKHPFLNMAMFTDRNFLTCTVYIFGFGTVMFATLALLPPMMQNLLNYPVVTAGFVTAPRGFGTMMGMMLVGRLIRRYDARKLIGLGLVLIVLAMWGMARMSPLMDEWPMVSTGLLQGFGLGLVYVPISTIAFATLPASVRNEGAAFFNLLRNLGSSIGISTVQILLTRNTQTLHVAFAADITPFNTAAQPAMRAEGVDLTSQHGLAALNAEITRQAGMIAYLDDYWLIMLMTLVLVPMLVILQKPGGAANSGAAVALD